MRIKECSERVVIQKIASVYGVLGVEDPVDASHVLGFIGLYWDAIEHLATRVRCLGQVFGESDCSRVEAAGTDLPVWQRLQGRPGGRIVDHASLMIGLAAGPVERAEVAGERRGRWDESGARGGILPNIGLLKTT